MPTYRFNNCTVDFTDPKIEKIITLFSIGDETVRVFAVLSSGGNKLYEIEIGFMENTDDWGDEELHSFVNTELVKYRIS